MSYSILTAYVDYESEDLLLFTDDLEAAYEAAEAHLHSHESYLPDSYYIYEAELGAKPNAKWDSDISRSYDPVTQQWKYSLNGWTC